MQPPQDANPMPPVYSLPPRSAGIPRWAMILSGCGVLLFLGFIVLGVGLSRLLASGKGALQTEFCVRNLQSAQRSLALYSQDYDQTLPRSAVWMETVSPYLKGGVELKCPVVRAGNRAGFGYAFNSKLSGVTAAKIDAAATTALVYDSTNVQQNAADAFTSLPVPPRHVRQGDNAAPNTPKIGNLVVYADGHMAMVGQDGSSVPMGKANMRKSLFSRPHRAK